MEKTRLHLPPELAALANEHLRLLTSENQSKMSTGALTLSGYSEVMHLITDILKVSIMALNSLDGPDNFDEPESNISGVLAIVLDLLPYEEAELLDRLRDAAREPDMEDNDWDFVLRSISLNGPSGLLAN